MARYGQRPENALKRANGMYFSQSIWLTTFFLYAKQYFSFHPEFIEVGKPARALDTLQEVFRNKKWAYNWSESVLEPIMFKYLDLCVELKKSHIAKEGLFQYRNMFQSVNVGSLENVIRGYLRMAEEKTENAREQSAQAVVDIDDLDNLATPESILLRCVFYFLADLNLASVYFKVFCGTSVLTARVDKIELYRKIRLGDLFLQKH